MTIRAAIYARVSKGEEQHPENQLKELREWAERLEYQTVEFIDEESSRNRRPQKEDLLRRTRIGEFNTIAVVRLDRWGRSMDELVLDLEELAKRGVAFISLREGLRFDDAASRLHAHMLAAFASFERDLIKERTLSGLARARSQGKAAGRHPVDCGCGARPEGRPPHDGKVMPVRDTKDGKRVIGWKWPNGTFHPVPGNTPKPGGGGLTEGDPNKGATSV